MTEPRPLDDQPGVIEFVPISGVIHFITPLSLATFRHIEMKAEELYPYPDKEPYMLPIENAADPSIKALAEQNPEYVELCKRIDAERILWRDWAVYVYCTKRPNYPDDNDLVNRFAPQLLKLRKITAGLPDDDFQAIVLYIVLSGNKINQNKDNALFVANTEYQQILNLAIQRIPLTPSEVAYGVRLFRPKV